MYDVPTIFVSGLASPDAQIVRGRLLEGLASPSGKLTISPEIIIPEPNDPTAILLQNNAITTLSERVRTAKGNSAFISGSINAIKIFCNEQEEARGNFPGPLPVVYCGGSVLGDDIINPQDLAEAGANGMLISVLDGKELESMDQLTSDDTWVSLSKDALESGVQPIPEITISDAMAKEMSESDIEQLVEKISTIVDFEPVSILLTMNPVDDEQEQVSIPTVPKSLGKKIPILGSVRVTAGENRLGRESQRFKENGFTGVVLRSDCVPGFRLNPDLDIVGRFWSACIGDLKSTRSKTFQFNSRNNMEKSASLEWAKYQKDVIDSGALGDPNDSYSVVDSSAGEYKGFA